MIFSFLKHSRLETEPRQESRVGCFGKLPIYDEFIRYNVTGRAVLDLDEWIQQGFAQHNRVMQTRAEKAELQRYTYNFAFTGSDDQHGTVIGSMMGSEDKCGRQYPFLLFKLLPNQNSESLSSTLPCAYKAFFDSAENLCSMDWSLQPINMLKKRVEALNQGRKQITRSDLMVSEISALKSLGRKRFWRETLGDSAEGCAAMCIDMMRDLLATAVRKSPLRTSWGIEIPLPANDQTHIHVSFWVRTAQSMLGKRGWRPHYIWGDTQNRQQQYLYLFFRPITPIFFSHLLGRRTDNGILINLLQESQTQQNVSESAKMIGDLNKEGDMVSVSDEWANWGRK
ncbi:MAG: type VI secretion system-associated protein TagF [Candidatus Thiodiazotropha sp.]